MATNEILPFASTNTGTNLLTQAEYAADAQRTTGNQPGIARSKLVNKSLRQASIMAAGLAEFIADYQSNNVTDSLTAQNIADYLVAAIRTVGLPTAVSGGTANALIGTYGLQTLTNQTILLRAGFANTSATPTLNVDGSGNKTIVKGSNQPLVAGDINGAGHWLVLTFDTNLDKWVLDNPARAVNVVRTDGNETITGRKVFANGIFGGADPGAGYAAYILGTLGLLYTVDGNNYTLDSSDGATGRSKEIYLRNVGGGANRGTFWTDGVLRIGGLLGYEALHPNGTYYPMGVCRAWANFNGNTNVIRASVNVSSIGDLGFGSYRINFGTAMPDASYSVNETHVSGSQTTGNALTAVTSGYFQILTGENNTTMESDVVCISAFR